MGGVQLAEGIDGEQLSQFALDNGVILRILRGNTVQISPPFIVTDEEVRIIGEVIASGLAKQTGAAR